MRLEFGFLPRRLDFRAGAIAVETLPGLGSRVEGLTNGPGVYRDWVYAPTQTTRDFSGTVSELPFPSRVFGLVKTHAMTHDAATDREHVVFLVWCLSFFVGMRLTTTEAGFVDATPLKPHSLTDFILSPSDESDALSVAETYWHSADTQSRKLAVAIIHALFLAQNPRLLQYEKFFHLYAAMDAAYALMKGLGIVGSARHFERAAVMCDALAIDTPVWARDPSGDSEVAALRNPTFHEALFSGEPLGFSVYPGASAALGQDSDILLEMEALICRFIVAVLGRPQSDYVKSSIITRQMHALDLR